MTEELFVAQVTDTLSVGDAAAELGVARSTVNRAVNEGRLRSVTVRGQKWIHAEWLELYRLMSIRKGDGEVETLRSVAEEPATQQSVAQDTQRSVAAPTSKEGLPPLGRAAPPALQNPRVQPRPKGSWLPKKGRSAQGGAQREV